MTIDPLNEISNDPPANQLFIIDQETWEVVVTIDGVEVDRLPPPLEVLVERSIKTKLEERLVDLQTIIDTPNVVLDDNNTATIRQALRDLQSQIKTLARVDRMQTKKLLNILDSDQ